jgi:hypothetical protein
MAARPRAALAAKVITVFIDTLLVDIIGIFFSGLFTCGPLMMDARM